MQVRKQFGAVCSAALPFVEQLQSHRLNHGVKVQGTPWHIGFWGERLVGNWMDLERNGDEHPLLVSIFELHLCGENKGDGGWESWGQRGVVASGMFPVGRCYGCNLSFSRFKRREPSLWNLSRFSWLF